MWRETGTNTQTAQKLDQLNRPVKKNQSESTVRTVTPVPFPEPKPLNYFQTHIRTKVKRELLQRRIGLKSEEEISGRDAAARAHHLHGDRRTCGQNVCLKEGQRL